MLASSRDDYIALGDVDFLTSAGSLPDGLRTAFLGIAAALVPLAIITAFDPAALRNPGGVLRFELFCLAVLLGMRWLHRLVMPGTCVAALFDRSNQTLELIQNGVFGTYRIAIPFDEIESVRIARGEWQAESASAMPIAVLRSKGAVALPACDARALDEIRNRTGLR